MAKLIGGDRLGPYLDAMAQRAGNATSVDVGFLENATYPDGTSVPMVAAINEFGTRTQPPRPFFRDMVSARSGEWPDAVANLLETNGMDASKTLDQVGAAIAGQLRESITSFTGAPLAESTVKAKGFAKQLIDTGVMSNSVDHRVNRGIE